MPIGSGQDILRGVPRMMIVLVSPIPVVTAVRYAVLIGRIGTKFI